MVQGVALELLCRLLFTEGSNPSLSVSLSTPNSPTLPTSMYQITMERSILNFRSFYLTQFISLFRVFRGGIRSLQSRGTASSFHRFFLESLFCGDKEYMQIESLDLNRHKMNSSMRPNSESKVLNK